MPGSVQELTPPGETVGIGTNPNAFTATLRVVAGCFRTPENQECERGAAPFCVAVPPERADLLRLFLKQTACRDGGPAAVRSERPSSVIRHVPFCSDFAESVATGRPLLCDVARNGRWTFTNVSPHRATGHPAEAALFETLRAADAAPPPSGQGDRDAPGNAGVP